MDPLRMRRRRFPVVVVLLRVFVTFLASKTNINVNVEAFTPSPITTSHVHQNQVVLQKDIGTGIVDSRVVSQPQQHVQQLNAAFVTDAETASSPSLRSRVKDFILSYREKRKPVVMEVDDVDILRYMLVRKTTTKDEYTALIFHAPFCKACQASMPLFQRLARKYTRRQEKERQRKLKGKYAEDHGAPVRFLSVAVTQSNSKLLEETFGITKYPMARIYHPQKGLIDERPALKKLFRNFEETLQSIVSNGVAEN
jgi:thiol-disulfide isomerase/thioredoxin